MSLTLPNQYDFLKRFFQLAIANVLSMSIIPLAGLISVAFLGHLQDIRYLAGVALATILFDYLYDCLGFLRWATAAGTAIAVGRDDQEAMLLVGLRNSLIALGLGILILILQYPLEELGFALFSATKEVKAAGITYFNARIWGAPAALLNMILIGWFFGREQSGKVLVLSVVGNGANILQDYVYIIHWDLASAGAGLSQAISQYLTLLVGMILVSQEISWKEVQAVAGKLFDLSAVQATFSVNGNLFVRNLCFASAFATFSNLGAAMGTMILAENALLLQIIMLSIYIFAGVAIATATLSGNFKGQKADDRFLPLLQVAIATSLLVGTTIAGVTILFPGTIFGVLTNHTEVTDAIKIYVPWLLLVLEGVAVSQSLEGYFSGLEEGRIIRNTFLISTALGFAPLAVCAWHFHSNHILWAALSMFMVSRVAILSVQLPKTFSSKAMA